MVMMIVGITVTRPSQDVPIQHVGPKKFSVLIQVIVYLLNGSVMVMMTVVIAATKAITVQASLELHVNKTNSFVAMVGCSCQCLTDFKCRDLKILEGWGGGCFHLSGCLPSNWRIQT